MYLRWKVRLLPHSKGKQRRDVPCSNDVFSIRDHKIQQVRTRLATLQIPTVRIPRDLAWRAKGTYRFRDGFLVHGVDVRDGFQHGGTELHRSEDMRMRVFEL